MEKRHSALLGTALSLTGVLLLFCAGAFLAETFVPNIILPRPDVTLLAGLSLAALAADAALFVAEKRAWPRFLPGALVTAVLVFWLLPWCAGLGGDLAASVRTGVLGGAVFLVCAALYWSMLDRLASGPVKHRRPMAVAAAALLWLACQALLGAGL